MNKLNSKKLFSLVVAVVIAVTAIFIQSSNQSSELDILPLIVSTKNHKEPLRKCGVFAEDTTSLASKGKLKFNDNGSFSFKYTKSKREGHAFTGPWFPLEKLNIDFSQFDIIEVKIKTNKARRIPLNLSNQNNIETHQYVRQFIEIVKGQSTYQLSINEFFTPTEWYDRNDVSQAEIPKQDFSKIEALSFESCHLLGREIEDEFTIEGLKLKKNLTTTYAIFIFGAIVLIGGAWVLIMKPFNKTEVVHVPIEKVEYEQKESLESRILSFLAKNYTNPNLTLDDLNAEFGKGKAEISRLIKEETKLTFPRYLNYLRIEEAKRILKKGDFETVSEVAFLVGFNSSSNFIRVFKAQEGVSPKKFLEG